MNRGVGLSFICGTFFYWYASKSPQLSPLPLQSNTMSRLVKVFLLERKERKSQQLANQTNLLAQTFHCLAGMLVTDHQLLE